MDGEGRRRANKLHKVAISAAGAAASQHGELMLLCSSDDAGLSGRSRIHPTQVAPIAMENARDSIQLFPAAENTAFAHSLDEDIRTSLVRGPRRGARASRRPHTSTHFNRIQGCD